MADSTWGVKVPDELKERAAKAMEDSNLSGKEFLEALLQAYVLKTLKETQPAVAPDIDELQILLNRIASIYVNVGERVSNLLQEKDDQYRVDIDGKESLIRIMDIKIKDLEQDLEKALAEKLTLQSLAEDTQKRYSELTETIQTNKALILEYKEKNDTLSGIVSEYQQYKISNDSLRTENQKLDYDLKVTVKDLEIARKSIDELQKKHEIDSGAKEEQHKDEINRLSERLLLEKEKANLEIRNEYQNKLEAAQEKINSIHDEYATKIKKLLDQISDLQNIISEKSSTPKSK